MSKERNELETYFPGLRAHIWDKTSEPTERYNCIAHAIGDARNWWWPGGSPTPSPGEDYWPFVGASDERLEDFVAPFLHNGFEPSTTADREPGFLKVAFYIDASGLVQHAARQESDGRWSSKLGQLADVAHPLEALEGPEYGTAQVFLRRAVQDPA